MELEAKYFSKISYEEEEIISFPNGIFGFEAYTRFILIRFDNHNAKRGSTKCCVCDD